MATGGTYTPGKAKVRPGVYINFKSVNKNVTATDTPGIVVIPFFNHTYGAAGEFITITADKLSELPKKLGYDIFSDNANMLLVREALKVCAVVKAYICSSGGTKATVSLGETVYGAEGVATSGIKATAKYAGTRGNDLMFVISDNVESGYDVAVYLGGEKVSSYEGLETAGDIEAINDDFVVFNALGDKALAPALTAGSKLTGGVDGTSTNTEYSKFLDALDHTTFKAVCLPIEPTAENASSMATAFVTKIKYLREKMGKTVRGCVAKHNADYIGIDNVCNAPILEDGTELTVGQVTAYVAGLAAGSTELDNNTNKAYIGAVGLTAENNLSHEEIEEAILAGQFVFTLSESDEVVIEYDINSLVHLSENQDESYKKNRVIRTFDAIADAIKVQFPVGKFSNRESDYDIMDGLGATMLAKFQEDGALTNVAEGDFAVDRNTSAGDSAFFKVAIQAVDSIVKSYFEISTK